MFQLRKALIGAGVLIAAGMAASAASAAPGYVLYRTSLLAGPGGQYPVVARMRAGDRVEIFGCTRRWAFCDVAWAGLRGWARGSALQIIYRDRRVALYQYAPIIGIPFVSFSISTYWGSHYRDKPWFTQAYRWGGPRDNNRPMMERPRPNMGSTEDNGRPRGSVKGIVGMDNSVNVERRNRRGETDMQSNTNIRSQGNISSQQNNPPRVREGNRRGDDEGGGGCGPGMRRVGGGCTADY